MSTLKKYPNWVCEICCEKVHRSLTMPSRNVEFKDRDDGTDDLEALHCEVCGERAATEETRYLGYPEFEGFETPQPDWIDE